MKINPTCKQCWYFALIFLEDHQLDEQQLLKWGTGIFRLTLRTTLLAPMNLNPSTTYSLYINMSASPSAVTFFGKKSQLLKKKHDRLIVFEFIYPWIWTIDMNGHLVSDTVCFSDTPPNNSPARPHPWREKIQRRISSGRPKILRNLVTQHSSVAPAMDITAWQRMLENAHRNNSYRTIFPSSSIMTSPSTSSSPPATMNLGKKIFADFFFRNFLPS